MRSDAVPGVASDDVAGPALADRPAVGGRGDIDAASGVAAIELASGVGADEVAEDDGLRVGRAADAVDRVGGDDVAVGGIGPADDDAGAGVEDDDAVFAVAGGGVIVVQADRVAANGGVRGPVEEDPVAGVGGDEVAGPGQAKRQTVAVDGVNAVAAVATSGDAVGGQADDVGGHRDRRGIAELHPVAVVAGDDVAQSGGADRELGAVRDVDPVLRVAEQGAAVGPEADRVAVDEAPGREGRVGDRDAVAGVAGDDVAVTGPANADGAGERLDRDPAKSVGDPGVAADIDTDVAVGDGERPGGHRGADAEAAAGDDDGLVDEHLAGVDDADALQPVSAGGRAVGGGADEVVVDRDPHPGGVDEDAVLRVGADHVAAARGPVADDGVVDAVEIDAAQAVAGRDIGGGQADAVRLDGDAVEVVQRQAVERVVDDDVAGPGGSDDDVVAVVDRQAAVAVAEVGGAVGAEPDRVGENRGPVGLEQVNAAEAAAADEVAVARRADDDARGSGDGDAGVDIADVGGAVSSDADEVAVDVAAGRERAVVDADAVDGPADDVEVGRGRSADLQLSDQVGDEDAAAAEASDGGAGRVRADAVAADDQVAGQGVAADAVVGAAGDRVADDGE